MGKRETPARANAAMSPPPSNAHSLQDAQLLGAEQADPESPRSDRTWLRSRQPDGAPRALAEAEPRGEEARVDAERSEGESRAEPERVEPERVESEPRMAEPPGDAEGVAAELQVEAELRGEAGLQGEAEPRADAESVEAESLAAATPAAEAARASGAPEAAAPAAEHAVPSAGPAEPAGSSASAAFDAVPDADATGEQPKRSPSVPPLPVASLDRPTMLRAELTPSPVPRVSLVPPTGRFDEEQLAELRAAPLRELPTVAPRPSRVLPVSPLPTASFVIPLVPKPRPPGLGQRLADDVRNSKREIALGLVIGIVLSFGVGKLGQRYLESRGHGSELVTESYANQPAAHPPAAPAAPVRPPAAPAVHPPAAPAVRAPAAPAARSPVPAAAPVSPLAAPATSAAPAPAAAPATPVAPQAGVHPPAAPNVSAASAISSRPTAREVVPPTHGTGGAAQDELGADPR